MLPEGLKHVTALLARLPGVGEKTALRYALELLADPHSAGELSAALAELSATVGTCERCGHFAERHGTAAVVCSICADPKRDHRLLCVVERVADLLAIERSGAMRGRYFVLGRLLSPLEGITPADLPLPLLWQRIEQDSIEELLIATPPSVDGEATALLLGREFGPRVRVSRIASGIPHGGDLQFANQVTLGRAIEGRRSLDRG